MYLIYGEELFLINKEIKKILKQNNSLKPIYFDFESSIYDVANEINTFSIFDDQKIIVCKNFSLLSKGNAEIEKEFINSISNKNDNCVLIFTFTESKPKTLTPLFKYLLENSKFKEVKKYTETQLIPVIRQIIESKNGIISNMNCILLSTKLPNDLTVIVREIEKLLLENKEITKEMILTSIPKYNSDNIFAFINSFQDKDASGLFKSYYEKIEEGETITNLISQLSNNLILCSNVHSYKSLKTKINEISEKMNIHIYRVKKADELLINLGIERIKNLIQILSNLDINIKRGLIDEIIGFEKLLLEIIR